MGKNLGMIHLSDYIGPREIEPEEVMIGCWYNFPHGYDKARGITTEDYDTVVVEWLDNEEEICASHIENVEAIPLHPNILEKIGYEYDKADKTWYHKEHKLPYLKGKGTILAIKGVIQVNYVHELQIILRVANINTNFINLYETKVGNNQNN